MNEPFDEGFIARYLLGDLSEQEQVEVEDRAFSDAQYTRNILAVEADLIDDYVQGGLHESERRLFESRFLASNERRKKVEFARAIAAVAAGSVVTATVRRPAVAISPASWWGSFLASIRSASPVVRISLAAASLVLVIGISLLIIQTIKIRGELAQVQAEQKLRQEEQRVLEQQLTDEHARNQDLATRLQTEQEQRQHNEELIRELERQREETANRPAVLLFSLPPGLPRSGAGRPKLVVPQSTRLVRLQIGIEPGNEYKSFGLDIRTQGGQRVWSQDNLRARSGRAGQTVVHSLPARVLTAGQYELALRGNTAQGKTEDVGYYYFEILKK